MSKTRCLVAAVLSPLVLAAACGDFSPEPYTGIPPPEGGLPEGGFSQDVVLESLPTNCNDCIADYCLAPCAASTMCANAYSCIKYFMCFQGHNMNDAVTCAIPCAEQAGIHSATDPGDVLLLYNLLDCAYASCQKLCMLQ